MRGFEKSLPMALMRARESVMRQFRPILRRYGLTEQQWRVLRALSSEAAGLDIGDLATATYLHGPSVSRIVANLEGRTLVTRTAGSDDGRRSRVTVTSAGLDLVAEVAPESEDRYRLIEAELGTDKLARLYTLLDDLAAVD